MSPITKNTAAVLADLQANHATMTIQELQARRGAALRTATVELNRIAEADDYDRDAFMALYDLIVELDRVGY